MSVTRCWRAGFAFAVVLALGATAAADPIQITSGTLRIHGVQDFGSRGFLRSIDFDLSTASFRVFGFESDGPTQNVLSPRLSHPVELSRFGGSPDLAIMIAAFTVMTTPALDATRFTLTGTLDFFQPFTGTHLFTADVFGRGTATWRFVQTPSGAPIVSAVTYEFTPVPEPVTSMLIGLGLVGLAAGRRLRAWRPVEAPTAPAKH